MSRANEVGDATEGMRRGLPYAALSGLLQIPFALLSMLLLVRYLPPDEYGVWVVLIGFGGPLMLAISLGYNHAILRFVPSMKSSTERESFLWSVWAWRSVVIAAVLALMWASFPWWAERFGLGSDRLLLTILLPGYWAIGSNAYLQGALDATFRQREVFWSFFVFQLAFVGGTVIGVWGGHELEFFSWVYVTAAVIQAGLNFSSCVRYFGWPKSRVIIRRKTESVENRRYRMTSWLDDLGTMLLSSPVNRLLLAALGSSAEVAIYAVASNVVDRLLAWQPIQLFRPIASVSIFSRYEKTGKIEDVNRMFRFIYSVNRSVTMLFVVLFIPFGDRILVWVFRPEYANSYIPACFLLLAAALFTAPTGVIAQTLKRPRVLLWSKVAIIVNLGIGIPMALRYGALGMAFAAALSTLVKNLIIYGALRLEFDLRFPWKTLLRYLGATGFSILVILALQRVLPWMVATAIGALVYFFALRLFSVMDEEDRHLLISIAPARIQRPLKWFLT